MSKKPLTQEEIEKNREVGLKSLTEKFLKCREWMHAWEEVTSYVSFRKAGQVREVTEVVKCQRCGTVRFDRLHIPSYDLIGRRYAHPEGYLLEGAGFTLRAHIRAEKFRRSAPSDIVPGQSALAELLKDAS